MPTETLGCLSNSCQRWQPLATSMETLGPLQAQIMSLENAETEASAVASHTVASDNSANYNDTSSGSKIPADDALNYLGASAV